MISRKTKRNIAAALLLLASPASITCFESLATEQKAVDEIDRTRPNYPLALLNDCILTSRKTNFSFEAEYDGKKKSLAYQAGLRGKKASECAACILVDTDTPLKEISNLLKQQALEDSIICLLEERSEEYNTFSLIFRDQHKIPYEGRYFCEINYVLSLD